ncbi:MAG: M48 family metallopeptidase [Candidatus Delongbacteria bacterium]|nr:M48 family metallopeptidase [bacterium]MBL7032512.1 M48 family metallopeptidase [Candidatus Delongbacteria bacterium]
MNMYLVIILAALAGEWLLNSLARYLNLRALDPRLPHEFEGECDTDKYRVAQEYTRTNTRFKQVVATIQVVIMAGFILLGGFNWVDLMVRARQLPEIWTGLLFFGVLFLLSEIVSLPFSIYQLFVIEEKYGFNRTTPGTFVLDKLKSYLLTVILGGPLLAGILAFFTFAGPFGWLWAWGVLTLFIIVIPTLYILVIAPMFNKFKPLAEGELKEAIISFAGKVNFRLRTIFVVDGSRRSSKANAYFTGLGRIKRIVLFDTLVEKHTVEELVSVLAHEVGHYRLKHVAKRMVLQVMQTGLMFYLLSLFLGNEGVFAAFSMQHISVYPALLFFSLLYTPVSMLLNPGMMAISRKHEYDADAWAAKSIGSGDPLISGLKRLAVENMSNLTPHPLEVALHYSHPPVLQRIHALRRS